MTLLINEKVNTSNANEGHSFLTSYKRKWMIDE